MNDKHPGESNRTRALKGALSPQRWRDMPRGFKTFALAGLVGGAYGLFLVVAAGLNPDLVPPGTRHGPLDALGACLAVAMAAGIIARARWGLALYIASVAYVFFLLPVRAFASGGQGSNFQLALCAVFGCALVIYGWLNRRWFSPPAEAEPPAGGAG